VRIPATVTCCSAMLIWIEQLADPGQRIDRRGEAVVRSVRLQPRPVDYRPEPTAAETTTPPGSISP
jgi:hypothetical protein